VCIRVGEVRLRDANHAGSYRLKSLVYTARPLVRCMSCLFSYLRRRVRDLLCIFCFSYLRRYKRGFSLFLWQPLFSSGMNSYLSRFQSMCDMANNYMFLCYVNTPTRLLIISYAHYISVNTLACK
jgi:hypothetical protein